MLKIVKLPNPILRQRAKEITVITPEIKTLAKNITNGKSDKSPA